MLKVKAELPIEPPLKRVSLMVGNIVLSGRERVFDDRASDDWATGDMRRMGTEEEEEAT